jgi:hypothetical protein
MEEVLYHPLIFKTTKCEEYASLTKDTDKKKSSKQKKRCHRYYCPFAHGDQELRTSSLDGSEIAKYLDKLEIFPSSECCKFCVSPCRPCRPALSSNAANALSFPPHNGAKPPRVQEEMLLSPILATAPRSYSQLLALRQEREQASLKEDLSAVFGLPSPFYTPPSVAQNSPTLSPLSKASSDFEETPALKDLPPPLKIHMDGFGGACLAPIYQPVQLPFQNSILQGYTQQKDHLEKQSQKELEARIYAML